MTATTPVYGLRYPVPSDPTNVPLDMQHLALDAENIIKSNQDAVTAALLRRVGGEVKANANQTVASAAATKLVFGANGAQPPQTNITWNGTNQFTILESGLYSLYASASTGFSSTGNWGVGIHNGTSAPPAGTAWLSSPIFATGQTDSFTSAVRYLAAGQTLSAWLYNNEAATRVFSPTTNKPAEFIVWKLGS